MSTTEVAIETAVGLMRNGDLVAAERACRQMLLTEPGRSDVVHLLGVVLLMGGHAADAERQLDLATRLDAGSAVAHYNRGNALNALGRFDEAVACFERAVAIRPDLAEAHCNRGNALSRLSRWQEAVAAYDAALALRPALVEALNNRGDALMRLGREAEALAGFDAALAIKPDHVAALNNRGNALRRQGRLQEALAAYDGALKLRPDLVDALDNRGLVLQELGLPEAALASFDHALALSSDRAGTRLNRAGALRDLRRFDEAVADCDRALALRPNDAAVLNARGVVRHEARQLDEAVADYRRALDLDPGMAEAWNNLGNALHDLDGMEEAEAAYRKALALRPDYPETIVNRGLAFMDRRRFEEAMADFDRAIELRAGYSEAYKRRGVARLLQGDYAAGWADYEASQQHWRERNPHLVQPIPYWAGEPLAGKRLLLSEPNGFGDTIMFFRYLLPMLEQGADISFQGPRSLFRLLASCSERIRFIETVDDPARYDYQASLWSLPHAFGTRLDDIPTGIPYLRAEPERVQRWASALDPASFNIGICWQGNPARKIDAARSIPLTHFQALADVPGVRLVSLQKHHGLDQLGRVPVGAQVQLLGDEFDAGADAFLDTAAIMQGLDLVVSCDSVVNHLAGALGRPAWIGLRYVPEFRWMLDRADSPWYPSLRLFRQPAIGDWASVFTAMAGELRKIAGQPRG